MIDKTPRAAGCFDTPNSSLYIRPEMGYTLLHPKTKGGGMPETVEKNLIFSMEETERRTFDEWLASHDSSCPYRDPAHCGAIGGRISYQFTPTNIGRIIKVVCACGQSKDCTNYQEW